MSLLTLIKCKIKKLYSPAGSATVDADGRVSEEFKKRGVMQQYGLASAPLPGAQGILLKQGEGVFLIASDDSRYRIALEEGEVALYNNEGSKILLKTGNEIVVQCSGKIHLKSNQTVVESGEIFLGPEALASLGGGVVTVNCVCSLTGAVHPMGSGSVKAAV